MPYTTQAKIERYVPNAPSDADFTGFIDDADDIINAHLRDRYDVPFSTTPDYVEKIATLLAAAFLRRAYFGQIREEPDALADRYETDAMKMLDKLVKNPSLIDVAPREIDSDDEEHTMVVVGDQDEKGVFSMEDETEWG